LNIEIRRFDGGSGEVVGVLQHARPGAPPRPSFLLCRPFAQEATRTASMYRVLSDRLAREGCEVLSFDYHGTGDSPGEEAEQGLRGWVQDIVAAHEQLCQPGGPAVHWFGMGLGATLATQAAARVARPPAHLVLWEPVVDGARYVQALFDGHRDELAREFSRPWGQLLRQNRAVEPHLPGDVLGFMVGATLADDLGRLSGLPLGAALRRGVRTVCVAGDEDRAALAGLAADSGGLLTLQALETRTNWMSSQAMGSAVVPPEVPRTLLNTFS